MTTDEWLQIAEDDAKVWANSCPRHVRVLVGELRRSRQILRDVRPMLCDILKLMSEFGAGNDYEAVAKVVDQIDTALGGIPACTIRGTRRRPQEFMNDLRGREVVYMGGYPTRIDGIMWAILQSQIVAASKPAPLDAPDAPVNPAATIRGLK